MEKEFNSILATNEDLFNELFKLRDSKYSLDENTISLLGITNYINRHYYTKIKKYNEIFKEKISKELGKDISLSIENIAYQVNSKEIELLYKDDKDKRLITLVEDKQNGDYKIKDSKNDNEILSKDSKVLSIVGNELFSLFDNDNLGKYMDFTEETYGIKPVNSSLEVNIDLNNVMACSKTSGVTFKTFDGKLMIYSSPKNNNYGFLSSSLRLSETANIIGAKTLMSKISVNIYDMPEKSVESMHHERKREIERILNGEYNNLNDIEKEKTKFLRRK